MKIETYRKGINLKHCCIAVVCSALILVPIAINTTRAKYQTSQSVPLIRGTINFKPYDFKIMAMYQESDSGEYEEVEVMPGSGYVINEEDSYCYTVTQEERDDTAVLYTDDQGQHVVGNLKKSSKCYLWFDKKALPGNETIIANATSTTTMPSITGISTDTSNTLYTVADDDGTSYVFRGNPSNNWVNFGGYYWRIIRINGDGSIRMIYNGTSTTTNGTGTQISGTHTYSNSGAYNDNASVGFMYGSTGASTYEATHTNTNNSNVKSQLEGWYSSSGLSSYAQYIDTDAGFCNDRSVNIGSETWFSGDTKLGYGTNATAYRPCGRIVLNGSWRSTQTPSLKCTNANQDLFTMSSSDKGNNKLSVPVGLITSDEVVFAGGFGGSNNTNYYLYTKQWYWTMSPYNFYDGGASVFFVNSNGYLSGSGVASRFGIRPVINLRSDVTLSGSGTSSDPYKIS